MEDILRHGQITALTALLVFTTSCSWYRNLERSLVGDKEKNPKNRTVPREQYDQLLVKYEELSKKYGQLKEGPAGKSTLMGDLQSAQGENFAQGSQGTETETVDLFGESAPGARVSSGSVTSDLESQITLFRRASALKATNPGEATKLFQQLEAQGVPAVRARAKIQIGDILLGKGQYDLALQVFEDIIHKHAHSGVVLDALKLAVACADNLGTLNKKEQYSSMLNDVFESK